VDVIYRLYGNHPRRHQHVAVRTTPFSAASAALDASTVLHAVLAVHVHGAVAEALAWSVRARRAPNSGWLQPSRVNVLDPHRWQKRSGRSTANTDVDGMKVAFGGPMCQLSFRRPCSFSRSKPTSLTGYNPFCRSAGSRCRRAKSRGGHPWRH